MFLPFLLKKVLVPVFIFYSIFSIYQTIESVIETSRKNDLMHKQILGLETQKKNLEDKFKVINSDDFVEKEARTKLNMKKEGEEVYIVPDSKENLVSDNISYVESSPNLSGKASNFRKWMELLF